MKLVTSFFVLALLAGCATKPPLSVYISANDNGCLIWNEGKWKPAADVSFERLQDVSSVVVHSDQDVPWKCVAGTIFNLQQTGNYRSVGYSRDGEMRELISGPKS